EDRLGRNGSSEVGLNWGEVSCAGSGLRARARHGVRSAVLIFPVIWSVCLAVKPVGEPDAGNPHIRFDERGWETGRCRMAQATAPILDSTFSDVRAGRADVRC